jgi:lysozyme family protein
MKDNFAASLSHVLASEGGFSDDPQDPGGATMDGVTQAVYDNWRASHEQSPRPVSVIDPNEVEAIYRSLYWNAVRGDDLPCGVDYCTFDFAVNSGAHQAKLCLQRALDVPVDGVIGPVTLKAVDAADPRRVINGVCSERLAYLRTLKTWRRFGNGWSHRVATVEQVARGMAA